MFMFESRSNHKVIILDKKPISFKEFKKEFSCYITGRIFDCYRALDVIQYMCDIVIDPFKAQKQNKYYDTNCMPIVTIVAENLSNLVDDLETYMSECQLRKLYFRLIPKDKRQIS